MSANGKSNDERTVSDDARPDEASEEQADQGALLALLRLLTREPPPGHDFKNCPICKRDGITEI